MKQHRGIVNQIRHFHQLMQPVYFMCLYTPLDAYICVWQCPHCVHVHFCVYASVCVLLYKGNRGL